MIATRNATSSRSATQLCAGERCFDPGEATDLRRKRERAMVEALLDRGAHLPEDDRALLEAVYRAGVPVVRLAALRGEGDTEGDVRRLRRRVRRLVARVLSDRYAFVARDARAWPRTRRRVAEACVLRGRSLRQASRELNLSLHTVRRHAEAIEALYGAARTAERA